MQALKSTQGALVILMQESLEESLAPDSFAVTRMEGRTASPGARRLAAKPRLCFCDTHFPYPIYLGTKG